MWIIKSVSIDSFDNLSIDYPTKILNIKLNLIKQNLMYYLDTIPSLIYFCNENCSWLFVFNRNITSNFFNLNEFNKNFFPEFKTIFQ